MFDDINKAYFISAILLILAIYWVIRHFRPKTWSTIFHKNGTRYYYMGYEKEGEAAELNSASTNSNKPVARVHDEGENGEQIIKILNGELGDDSNQSDYRTRGYITPNGLIYKKPRANAEAVVVGYTARESDPKTPTVRGERTWNTLWLESELNVYLGEPGSSETPKRVAHVYIDGITPFRNRKCISTEAKAGASSLLYTIFGPKEDNDSIYKDASYTWNDTALLASIVYSVLFMILYFFYTGFLHRSLLGDDIQAVFLLGGCYFAIWALLREYKIHRIENSTSIQPQLDMLNKGLSLGKSDALIATMGGIAMIFTLNYYDYDFLPLLFAITFGVGKNGLTTGVRKPWKVVGNYDEERMQIQEDELTDFTSLPTPIGNIKKTFSWDLDSRCAYPLHSDITVAFDLDQLTLQREANPFFLQHTTASKRESVSRMFQTWLESKPMQERTIYIARYLEQECNRNKLEELDRLQYLLDFVQEPNIKYMQSKESKSIQYAVEYMRFPDETLFDQEGGSDCKAFLAAALLHAIGYNVLYIASTQQQHSAIAIELSDKTWTNHYFTQNATEEKAIIEQNGRRYIYCETSGDGFFIGNLVKGMHIEDFDIKVELPLYGAEEQTDEEDWV